MTIAKPILAAFAASVSDPAGVGQDVSHEMKPAEKPTGQNLGI